MEKIVYVCGRCGSDNIAVNAAARWNRKTQAFELYYVTNGGVCKGCHSADLEIRQKPLMRLVE